MLSATVWGAAPLVVGPGETYNWSACDPAQVSELQLNNCTFVYDTAGGVSVPLKLTGDVDFRNTSGTEPYFRRKIIPGTGRLVLHESVTFGSDDSNAYAFLPENALVFAADAPADARVALAGYVSCTVMPDRWSAPVNHVWQDDVCVSLYGTDMIAPDADGAIRFPTTPGTRATWRLTSANTFSANGKIIVPEKTTFIARHMTFNAETGTGGAISRGWSNDDVSKLVVNTPIHLDGGTYELRSITRLDQLGAITGRGTIDVKEGLHQSRYFFCPVDVTADTSLQLSGLWDGNTGANAITRFGSSFNGKVFLWGCASTNIVSFGFATPDSRYETNSCYRVGEIFGERVAGNGAYGVRYQYNKNQEITIGRMRGQLSIYGSSLSHNRMIIEDFEAGMTPKLWIRNGLKLTLKNIPSNSYPHLYFTTAPSASAPGSSNLVTFTEGGTVNTVEVQGTDNVVYVRGDGAISTVKGTGRLVVLSGEVRIGSADADTRIVAAAGSVVTLGSGVDVRAVLADERLGLWLDASATNGMVGAWNAGWAATDAGKKVLQNCPAVTFNGASTATWTNGFPLIEKWFDKRPEQRLNYGWQDRCVNYNSTLHTLVYPYLVPNALNGRPVMSFGAHGTTDLDTEKYGQGGSKDSESAIYKRELRRMPFMQDMRTDDPTKPEGHAVYVGTAVVVFGSQYGGGRAVLGGYRALNGNYYTGKISETPNGRADWADSTHNPFTSDNFGRGGTDDDWDAETPIFSETAKASNVYVDETAVDGTVTGLNGGWQILAWDGGRMAARSLGMGTRYVSAGGQNYAEILIYTNKITTVERRAVEAYLALKWGLPNGFAVKGQVTAEAGAVVKGEYLNPAGMGVWRMDSSPEAAPVLDGTFAGTLELPVAFDADGALATEPYVLNGALGAATVRAAVSLAAAPQSGTYVVAKGPAVTAAVATALALPADRRQRRFEISVRGDEVLLTVRSGGTFLVIR